MRIKSVIAFMLILFCVTGNAQVSSDNVYILSLADIHFDPFIACQNTTPCPLIDKLSQASVSEWPALFSPEGNAISVYREDTNYALLRSALANAKQVAQKQNPQFILVLGDLLGHEFRHKYYKFSQDKTRAGYHAFIYKTLEFLTVQLRQAFPDKDIYTLVGNNDSYQDDYVSDPGGAFFHEVGQLWSGLIKENGNSMREQFAAAGYYALDIPGHANLRLIVINTNLFSYLAAGKQVTQAAAAQLDWLHQELQLVKDHNQKALIAMHIPEGIDIFASFDTRLNTMIHLWKRNYIDSFDATIAQYSPNIMAILTGHLHADWFQMLSFGNARLPNSGTPSISPIYGNNPGFKMYSYSPQDLKLASFVTHFYPLSFRRVTSMEYGFNQYQDLQCEDCKMPGGADLIQQTSLYSRVSNFFMPENIGGTGEWSSYYQCAVTGAPVKLTTCN